MLFIGVPKTRASVSLMLDLEYPNAQIRAMTVDP